MHQLHRDRAYVYRYTSGDNNYKSIVSRGVFIGLFNANIVSVIINCRASRVDKIALIIRTEYAYHKRNETSYVILRPAHCFRLINISLRCSIINPSI